MVDRLALSKFLSPELREQDSYNRDAHAWQMVDDITSNYANVTGQSTSSLPSAPSAIANFIATSAAAPVVVFDSASGWNLFKIKTLVVSSDAISQVDLIIEDESGGVGAGTPFITLFMAANSTEVVPFAFGDKAIAGLLSDGITYRLVATASAGNASVTASGQAFVV